MLDRTDVLPHMLAARAAAQPDDVCFVDIVEDEKLTYSEFDEAIRLWAGAFREFGIDASENVVTMLPNNHVATSVWLGLAWLRAVEVPLNTAYRGPMLEYIVNNSDARVAVVAERFLDRFMTVDGDLENLETIIVPDLTGEEPESPFRVIGRDEFFAGVGPATDLDGPDLWDVSCIIYTSGTTGPSKGVLVPWGELYQFGGSSPDGLLGEGESYYMALPQFHVGGKSGVYISTMFGGRLVLRDTFSPMSFWGDVREHDVVAAGLVGPMAAFLMSLPPSPADRDHPLRSCTMGPLIPNIEEFKERFGVLVSTGYGMTEIAAPLASVGFDLVDGASCGKVRTGYPGYEVKVVDEYDYQVAPGEVGELIVRTREPWMLNSGYYKMPEATARAWRNGWFHTGDGFRYDEDGNYYFVDRIKDAIRRRGENISSFEVEAYVTRHPAVVECAAVAVPSEFGEDDVKAIVVLKEGEDFTPEALIEFLIPIMPRFMIPRYVEITTELPKTQTLRVRKVELREDSVNERTWDREAAGIELPK